MSDWQPIETAPKDGTRVLVWIPSLGHAAIDWYSGIYGYTPKATLWTPLPDPPEEQK